MSTVFDETNDIAARIDAFEIAEGSTVSKATMDSLKEISAQLKALGAPVVVPAVVAGELLPFPLALSLPSPVVVPAPLVYAEEPPAAEMVKVTPPTTVADSRPPPASAPRATRAPKADPNG